MSQATSCVISNRLTLNRNVSLLPVGPVSSSEQSLFLPFAKKAFHPSAALDLCRSWREKKDPLPLGRLGALPDLGLFVTDLRHVVNLACIRSPRRPNGFLGPSLNGGTILCTPSDLILFVGELG